MEEQKYRNIKSEPERVQTNSQSGSPKNSFERKIEEATVVKVTGPDRSFIDDILATLSNSYRTTATSDLRFNSDRFTYYIFVNVSKRERNWCLPQAKSQLRLVAAVSTGAEDVWLENETD